METFIISGGELTSECWTVQMKGVDACETCELKDTDECGGQEIRATGKNANGLKVPIGRRK